jgi:hypothetical protein
MFDGLKQTIKHEVVGFFIFTKSLSWKGSCKMNKLEYRHNSLERLLAISLIPLDHGEGVRC